MNNVLTVEDEDGKKIVVLPQIIFMGKERYPGMRWKNICYDMLEQWLK